MNEIIISGQDIGNVKCPFFLSVSLFLTYLKHGFRH